jgi:hypothetical protein
LKDNNDTKIINDFIKAPWKLVNRVYTKRRQKRLKNWNPLLDLKK